MLVDNNKIVPRNMDTLSIVNVVFAKEPLPPYTYNIALAEDAYNVTLFQLLMNILMCGAKKIYGDFITADNLTKDQFEELQKYMMSIGYIIKYNYTYNKENIPIKVNIWFEPYMYNSKCNGIITF
jgi:hypothetical protein